MYKLVFISKGDAKALVYPLFCTFFYLYAQ